MLAQSKFPSTKPTPLRKPPPLDFAQLIAQRRASRVAQNTQMEANTNHFWNLKNSIELENAFQEKQRMSSFLRLGSVPAHVSHPIAAALAGGMAMEVDEEVMIGGLVQKVAQRTKETTDMPARTREKLKIDGTAHMEDFSKEETDVGRQGAAGVQARLDFPADLVSRNLKMRARNAETRKTFANTDARRAS